jgi:class 3 adenylate cyclase
MTRRAKVESSRLKALLGIMRREELAPRDHVVSLAADLEKFHGTDVFHDCRTMGELTAAHVSLMLDL